MKCKNRLSISLVYCSIFLLLVSSVSECFIFDLLWNNSGSRAKRKSDDEPSDDITATHHVARAPTFAEMSRSRKIGDNEDDNSNNHQNQKEGGNIFDKLKKTLDMNLNFHLMKLGIRRNLDVPDIEFATRCFDDIGCIEMSEDWYGFTRPVNMMPDGRKEVNTTFYLKTRESLNDEYEFMNISSLSYNSTFDPSIPTKFVIHGFLDSGFTSWVEEMVDALLTREEMNVFVVNWKSGSNTLYSQAVANTRLVALEIAYFIKKLKIDPSKIHLIGHSLGAHISGYVGQNIHESSKKKISRISGLDPAQPLFESMPNFVRLDASDATFVDVIHSDGKSILLGGYGTMEPCGHVDFYPNGGLDQPGCKLEDINPSGNIDSMSRHLVACNHMIAVYLYINSINETFTEMAHDTETERSEMTIESSGTCKTIGLKCDSYDEYSKGSCTKCGPDSENCAPMGYNADLSNYKQQNFDKNGNIKFYFSTTAGIKQNSGMRKFMCSYNYVVKVEFDELTRKMKRQGTLKVSIHGTMSQIFEFKVNSGKAVKLDDKPSMKFIVTSPTLLGEILIVNVYWLHSSNPFEDLTSQAICILSSCSSLSNAIYVKSVSVDLVAKDFQMTRPPVKVDNRFPKLPRLSRPNSSTTLSLTKFCPFSASKQDASSLVNSSGGRSTVNSTSVQIKSDKWGLFYRLCDDDNL